jgi:hypothetical protein
MSAWGIGAGLVAGEGAAAGTVGVAASTPQAAPTVDTLVSWIPGEVIAAYMALVLALQPNNPSGVTAPTSKWWLVGAIVASGAFTFLGGFAKSPNLVGRKQWLELFVRVGLSAIAFALWSLVLPGSWWQSIDKIANNAAAVAVIAGIGAAAFGLLAQGIVNRLPK